MKTNLPLRGRGAFLLSLTAGTLGFALNRFGLPVFGGTELVFGGAITLLAVYLLGPWWGALTTGIAFSATWLAWGHPWALLCFTLEAWMIGWLKAHRGLHPLKGAVLYWSLVGVPLAALGILGQTDYPFPANWAIVVKYPVNSLLMAMFALPLYYWRPFRQFVGLPLDRDAHTPLRRVLFLRLGLIVTLSIATLGLFTGRAFDETLRDGARERLHDDGHDVAIEVNRLLDGNLRAITQLAHTLAATGADATQPLQILRALHPSFLTLLATDASGRITAACAAGPNPAPLGLSVADRPYFLQPQASGSAFVSDVFRGRGFGHDPIVAMSAPIVDRSGRFLGIVEGSLNLSRLLESLGNRDRLAGRTIVVVDRMGRVVAAHGTAARPLHSFSGSALHFAARESASGDFVYDNREHDRAERFAGTNHRVPGFGWEVFLAEPMWRTQATIARFYLTTALVAGAAIGLALLLARGTATEITQPLARLVEAMRRLAQGEAETAIPTGAHASRELADIGREFQAATLTLSRANRELAAAMADRDRSHEQLQQVLVGLEDKVRERTEQLEEARHAAESASEAKSEFLASMSHELRTPLNVIVGMSELIGETSLGPLNERQLEGVQNINESGRHLLELINDILDLSKIEAGMLELHRQPMDVTSLGQASVRFVQEAARKKNIRLETDFTHVTETVIADERRVKQVLVNLLANAVKFTPAGGRVGLEVREDATHQTLRFVVWDTGIGISPENFERIFRPFEQIDSSLSRQYAGTGLGLALVRRMTELHGGRIDLESETGQGSRFCVSIPLVRPDDTPATAGTAPTAAPAEIASRLRILVAEDNEANHQVYRAFFAARGGTLLLARDGAEAVELALRERPDLILMDVQMPVMDGITAIRHLRGDPRTEVIPIIAVTALAMPQDRLRCLEAGANAYLSKPINLRELARQVARFSAPAPVALST